MRSAPRSVATIVGRARWPAIAMVGIAALVVAGCTSRQAPPVSPVDTACPPGSIIALGDSITYGAGLPRGKSYPADLEALLHRSVCNAGVNGDTAVGGLKRLQRDVLQFSPAAVVVLFGTNDCGLFGTPVPLNVYRADLTAIVRGVRSVHGRPLLASLPPLDASLLRAEGLDPSRWAEYDGAIRSVARDTGVPIIDLTTAFSGNVRLLSDGIHPTAEGAALIARTVAAALERAGVAQPQG